MSPKWTDSQKRAIDVRNKNVIVSAAAGSGKTTVLVERVINILSDRENSVRADQLLIVTFTNAAATEMRNKIYNAILKKVNDEPENEHLKKQLVALGQAQISTIHSLCNNMLKNNFHLLNIRKDFEIASETTMVSLRKKAMETVLENWYQKNDANFFKTVDCFGGKKNDEDLIDILTAIFKFSQSLPSPVKWLEYCIESAKESKDEICFNINKEYAKEKIKYILDKYTTALNIIENDKGMAPYRDVFVKEKLSFSKAYQRAETDFLGMLKLVEFPRLPSKGKTEDEAGVTYVKSIRDKARKTTAEIIELLSYPKEEIEDERKKTEVFVTTVCELVIDYTNELNRIKTEENVLEFSDLEHLTVELLEKNDDFRIQTVESFKEILVDEYQDTSGVQARLFELLSNGNNLFMVGDVKQSIYNFRNSNPKYFMEKYNQYTNNTSAGEKILLSHNFRSSEGIIEFINKIFTAIMSDNAGGVDYNDEHTLKYGNESVKTIEPSVEINCIEYNPRDEYDLAEDEIIADKHEAESRFIARRIIKLVEEEKPVIIDKETNIERPINYGDIAILIRNAGSVSPTYVSELTSFGIPVTAQETGSYLMSLEIATVLSYLKIIDNPLQDVPMLAIMRSPIFGFDDNHIASMRADCKKTNLYIMLKMSEDQKAKDFVNKLDQLIDLSKYNTVDYIVRKIVFDTGYYEFVGNLPDGQNRMANLELLCKRASDFALNGFKGISNYINYINDMIEGKEEYSSSNIISSGSETVKIMTIHKSKGLEYPVVFLAGCSGEFNKMDLYKSYIYDENYGIVTDVIDRKKNIRYSPIFKSAIKNIKYQEIVSEEVRLLYVALTRAKYKLFISGVVKSADGSINSAKNDICNPSVIRSKKCYLDWILCAVNGEGVNKIYPETLKKDLSVKSVLDKTETKDYSSYYEKIDDILKYTYPYEDSKSIPSKKSISEIVAENDDVVHLSKITSQQGDLTLAQRGTVIHYVLQNINLNEVNSVDEINRQVDDMILNGMLENEYKKYIDVNTLYEFFQSNIGKRLTNSDKVYREFKFCVDIPACDIGYENSDEKVLMQGVIDCCFNEDGEYVIIDYKTGRDQEKYQVQLELYKKCFEIATGKKVKETEICPLI